ncbi:MAG: translation initiation factor 2 [Lachnospiraceae bacterium]|nr:translation initiation factor 2 [Lachnospiraceae bacterium]
MKGRHRIVVSTKRLKYDFEVRRNLTMIRGDSATGKTTLIDMIRDYVNNPSGTPVNLTCDKKCYVLEGALWKEQLKGIIDSIIFIDEGNEFIKSVDFAEEIQKTDNYYVIVTRESLSSLPYSIEEIYGIRTSGKYGTLKQSYHEFYQLYGVDTYEKSVKPDIIITEDSNSGYQFFAQICQEKQLDCESMNGKSNVFHYLNIHKDEKILVIADGAAFGSEMDRVLQLINKRKNVALYLPESFEWLVLSAGVLKNNSVVQILKNPSEYIESKEYFSWERFFTAVLIQETKDTYLTYAKKKLNAAYLSDMIKNSILKQMKKIEL